MNHEMLLDLAKQSIEDELYNKSSIDALSLENDYAFLSEPRATFVTLTSEKRLRGCMGSLLPHRKLLDDIIHNAKAAAFQDYRFQPLSKKEFPHIDIEVSLLSLPKVLIYSSLDELKEKIQPGVHGVILRKDHNKATFLPQVWDQLPSFELFFEHLCQKAGLCQDCLKQFPEIETYEVEKIKRQ